MADDVSDEEAVEEFDQLAGDSSEDDDPPEFDPNEGGTNPRWSSTIPAPYVSRSVAEAQELVGVFHGKVADAVAVAAKLQAEAKEAGDRLDQDWQKRAEAQLRVVKQGLEEAKMLHRYAKFEASFAGKDSLGRGQAQLLAREAVKLFPELKADGTVTHTAASKKFWRENMGTYPRQVFASPEVRALKHWDPVEGWSGYTTVGTGESAMRIPRKIAARNEFYATDLEVDWGFDELGTLGDLMREEPHCRKKDGVGKDVGGRMPPCEWCGTELQGPGGSMGFI